MKEMGRASVSLKYMNHGECAVCHKNKPLLMVANICEDCLNGLIDETRGV